MKIGASVLTDGSGRLRPERLRELASQVAACSKERRQLVLVSSGAIACGMAKLGLASRPGSLAQLQACAAIGQSELMHLYTVAFSQYRILAAQVLLTQDDFASRMRYRNAKQTLLTLLHKRAVPIINENDTVSVEEITFGDNDRLAALVASVLDAQLLIVLSDVDGLLRDGKPVERVDGASHAHSALVRDVARHTTKGGMASKLEAARIVGHSGIPMVIANGTTPGVLRRLLDGQRIGTLFVPPRTRLTARKWWIAFALREPQGSLAIDGGAAQALLEKGRSLLASGIQAIHGRFEAGAFVRVMHGSEEIARGVCNVSSAELTRVRGMRSDEVARTLGLRRAQEVIHRDNLVLARDVRR